MNLQGAQRYVILGALVAAAIITWGQVRQKQMPPPYAYLGVVMVYSVLGLLAEPAPQMAGVLAVGVTAGLGYAYVNGHGAATVPGPLIKKGSAAAAGGGGRKK